MSTGKLLEFFIRIPKLLPDGSNWVIFKDRFHFAAAAAVLQKHLDGTDSEPAALAFPVAGPTPLTAAQTEELKAYEASLSKWQAGEAVLKQAIASTIPDSLFLDVRKEKTAKLMWDSVSNKREKKSRMVTVDLRRKLQLEKCEENGDVRTHLFKLQTMREDLASMGGSISDEDFTTIVLGSIPYSYDTFISAMSATSSLLGTSLSPSNLIDAIGDEADRKAIKSPTKSKKDKPDAAFAAGQRFQDKRRGNGGPSRPKRDVECYNCHKKGHVKADCWAAGGGSEGKGPRSRKGKEKETAAKAGADADTDGVWMANAESNVQQWLDGMSGENLTWDVSESVGESWEGDLRNYDAFIDECLYPPMDELSHNPESLPDLLPNSPSMDLASESDISEFMLLDTETCPGLQSVSDSSSEGDLDVDGNWFGVPTNVPVSLPSDIGLEATTHTFDAAMLANSTTRTNVETELYDSGASRHMSPYRGKFIDYIDIEPKTITAADAGTFQAVG